jgi:opacity protein-like surface antigen
MKRVLFAGILISLVVGMAVAQDFPKAELFGGYSLVRISGNDAANLLKAASTDAPTGTTTSRVFKKGFDASFTYNLKSYVGIEIAGQYNTNDVMKFNGKVPQFPGDTVGYNYKASVKMDDFSVMVGPKFAYRKHEKVTPYAHILMGLDRLQITPSLVIDGTDLTSAFTTETGIKNLSSYGFGLIIGGGIDLNINDYFAVRPIQLDFLMGKRADFASYNAKISFGVVFRFGTK